MTGQSREKWEKRWGVGGRETFLFPFQQMGVKTKNVFHSVIFILSELRNTHSHVFYQFLIIRHWIWVLLIILKTGDII
jgi:hypothetical protein